MATVTIAPTLVGSYLKLWKPDGANNHRKKLLISAHGGSVSRPGGFATEGVRDIPGLGGWFKVPDWTELKFFGPHKKILTDPERRGIVAPTVNNTVMYAETATSGQTVRNYRLTHYEKEKESSIKRAIDQDDCEFDIVQLLEKSTLKGVIGYTLKCVLDDLSKENQYEEIYCSFCRCTTLQLLLEKIGYLKEEDFTHDAYDNVGSINKTSLT